MKGRKRDRQSESNIPSCALEAADIALLRGNSGLGQGAVPRREFLRTVGQALIHATVLGGLASLGTQASAMPPQCLQTPWFDLCHAGPSPGNPVADKCVPGCQPESDVPWVCEPPQGGPTTDGCQGPHWQDICPEPYTHEAGDQCPPPQTPTNDKCPWTGSVQQGDQCERGTAAEDSCPNAQQDPWDVCAEHLGHSDDFCDDQHPNRVYDVCAPSGGSSTDNCANEVQEHGDECQNGTDAADSCCPTGDGPTDSCAAFSDPETDRCSDGHYTDDYCSPPGLGVPEEGDECPPNSNENYDMCCPSKDAGDDCDSGSESEDNCSDTGDDTDVCLESTPEGDYCANWQDEEDLACQHSHDEPKW